MAAAKLGKREDGGGPSLPEDTILEVLVRLPAKTLRRFRCVSTSWRALISGRAFVAALRSRAATAGPLIVAEFGWQELRLLDKRGNALMKFDIGGYTALLAPARLDRILLDRGQRGAMIVDPAASGRDFTKKLRPPPSWADDDTVTSDYSFGRATASGHGKVLRLTTSSSTFPHEQWCHVATITDGGAEPTWRERPWGPFYDDIDTSFSCEDKATANGVLYFMLHFSESHGRHHIAAFDLESEEWEPFEKNKGPVLRHKNKDDKWRITLTELKGALCLVHNVQYLSDLFGHYADIWLLKDPSSCVWVKEYKIKMPRKRLLLFTKPLDVLTDGKLLLLNEFQKDGTTNCRRYVLQLYDSSTKAFTEFMEMAPGFSGGMALYTGNLYA